MTKSTNGSRAAQFLSCPSSELNGAKQINPRALAGETNVVEDGTVRLVSIPMIRTSETLTKTIAIWVRNGREIAALEPEQHKCAVLDGVGSLCL